MAKATHLIHSSNNTFPFSLHPSKAKFPCSHFHNKNNTTFRFIKAAAASNSRDHEVHTHLITRKGSRARRGLVMVPAGTGGSWSEEWSCEYIFTLDELHLEDLAEDGSNDTEVFITLFLHKLSGTGLSVRCRVTTSIARICCVCSSAYCSKIDTNFKVWVLPSYKEDQSSIREIGLDDPSVIYVKPGDEADLDSYIEDAIRLQMSVHETCSDICENSEYLLECRYTTLHHRGLYNRNPDVVNMAHAFCADDDTPATASPDRIWSKLLEIRKTLTSTYNANDR